MGKLTISAVVIALSITRAVEGAAFRAPLHVSNRYASAVSLFPIYLYSCQSGFLTNRTQDAGGSNEVSARRSDLQKPLNIHHPYQGIEAAQKHGTAHRPFTVSPGTSPSSITSSVTNRLPPQKNLTHNLVYFTEIAVGSPPQPIQALIDISAQDSFIPSSNCTYCKPDSQRFNSSASSSFRSNCTAIDLDYSYLTTSGTVAQDTFHFGSLQVEDQLFQEANEVLPIGVDWDDRTIIQSIISLAPSSAGSVQNVPSPFMNMASQGVLDSSTFALRLREPREVMFGGTNRDLYTGNFTRIPLAVQTKDRNIFTGGWQVVAKSISLGYDSRLNMSLDGYTATFSTGWAALGLPWEVASNFITALDFDEDIMFMPASVACKRRAEMPDISINLAGHDFVLSAYDYTYEWPMGEGEVRCVAAFAGFEFEHQEKMIVLGSSFLRAFYTVFDLEDQSIGCKSMSNKALERVTVLTLASRKTVVTECLSTRVPISMDENSNPYRKGL